MGLVSGAIMLISFKPLFDFILKKVIILLLQIYNLNHFLLMFKEILMCNEPRTSVNMDGTHKFVNYKVGGIKTPIDFLKATIFCDFFRENTFLCT